MYIIGIYGDDRKTEGLLYSLEDGEIMRRSGEASHPFNSGVLLSVNRVAEIVGFFLRIVKHRDVKIVIGIDGLHNDEIINKWTSFFEKKVKMSKDKCTLVIESHALIALYSGTNGMDGIVSIANTDTVSFAKKSKTLHHIGGWGHLVGSAPGSNYYLGYRALESVIAEYEGMGIQTVITKLLKDRFKVDDVRSCLPKIYKVGEERHEIAGLADIVFLAHTANDVIAKRIIDEAAEALIKHIKEFTKHFGDDEKAIPYIVIGDLFTRTAFKNLMVEKIKGYKLPVKLVKPKMNPVNGAIILAMKNHGHMQLT